MRRGRSHSPYKQPRHRHQKGAPKPSKLTPKSIQNHVNSRLCAKVAIRNPLHRHRGCEPRASQDPPKTLKKGIWNFARVLKATFDGQSSANDVRSAPDLHSFPNLFGFGFALDPKCASGFQRSLKKRAPGLNTGSKYGLRASKSLRHWGFLASRTHSSGDFVFGRSTLLCDD